MDKDSYLYSNGVHFLPAHIKDSRFVRNDALLSEVATTSISNRSSRGLMDMSTCKKQEELEAWRTNETTSSFKDIECCF